MNLLLLPESAEGASLPTLPPITRAPLKTQTPSTLSGVGGSTASPPQFSTSNTPQAHLAACQSRAFPIQPFWFLNRARPSVLYLLSIILLQFTRPTHHPLIIRTFGAAACLSQATHKLHPPFLTHSPRLSHATLLTSPLGPNLKVINHLRAQHSNTPSHWHCYPFFWRSLRKASFSFQP